MCYLSSEMCQIFEEGKMEELLPEKLGTLSEKKVHI